MMNTMEAAHVAEEDSHGTMASGLMELKKLYVQIVLMNILRLVLVAARLFIQMMQCMIEIMMKCCAAAVTKKDKKNMKQKKIR